MVVVWILLALIVGFVLGHYLWTKTITKIETVFKEVPKIVKEEVVVHPEDWDNYLEWAKHKEDWINLQTMIPDYTIQDDDKFEKVMMAIERALSTTESGDITPAKNKKKKNN